MVNIRDVAKKANVSLGTASRALRGNGYVSEEKKRAVLKAAKKMGYVVNIGARNLKEKDPTRVGIVVSDINNPYFFKVISSLQSRLKEKNYELIVAFSNNNAKDEESQIKYLIGNNVSFLFFIPTSFKNGEVLKLAKKNGVKIVQLFIKVYDEFPAIVNDDELGTYLACEFLKEEGYKKIALVNVKYSRDSFADVIPARENGLYQFQNETNSEVLNVTNFSSEPLSNDAIQKIEDFNPDAIIAGTGNLGLSVLEYLKRTSRKVCLVSFDDNGWLEYHGISAIRQNEQELENAICNLIFNPQTYNEIDYVKIGETLVKRKQELR